ncbi:ABC transporter, permease protein (cluster 3, basic aa/glutamine/opines) [Olavius algarvensis Delta 1 endosymbiont]|nr:ABC transporter, permease protein (cluster 3, basic aa/glutamine/opines) [Olavius algarvensis Delta 1 endosymbiont]
MGGNAYNWDFISALLNWRLLSIGLVNTIKLAAVCLVCGLFLGLFVGAARYSKKWVFNWPATVFVEVFRNTPALVQIMWFFFALPILLPFDIDSFTAAFLGLMLNTVAFSAEIFRGGIQSIAPGQWEAGKAIGMTYVQQMRRVILPQAIKRMIPAFTNRGVELTKMTSLASVIAYAELIHQAKTISTMNFNPIETYTIVAVVYFFLIFPITLLVRRFEKKANE